MGARYPMSTRVFACLSYGATSISITLFNKAVFSIYNFHYPNFVSTLQILVSLTFLWVMRTAGALTYSNVTRESAKQAAAMVFFWWLYLVSGVTALRFLNVPMYSTLRRVTTLMVALGEVVMFGKTYSPPASAALFIMVVGAIVAGVSDLSFSLPGYCWMTVLIFSTAAYLLSIRTLNSGSGMNQETLLWHNNLMGLPIMLLMLVFSGELPQIPHFPQLYDPYFMAFLLLSAAQAFLLNLCIFKCTTINSPLATSVTGQIKDILTMALGVVLFRDVQYHPVNLLGLAVGLTGGISYSYVSFREQRQMDTLKRISPDSHLHHNQHLQQNNHYASSHHRRQSQGTGEQKGHGPGGAFAALVQPLVVKSPKTTQV